MSKAPESPDDTKSKSRRGSNPPVPLPNGITEVQLNCESEVFLRQNENTTFQEFSSFFIRKIVWFSPTVFLCNRETHLHLYGYRKMRMKPGLRIEAGLLVPSADEREDGSKSAKEKGIKSLDDSKQNVLENQDANETLVEVKKKDAATETAPTAAEVVDPNEVQQFNIWIHDGVLKKHSTIQSRVQPTVEMILDLFRTTFPLTYLCLKSPADMDSAPLPVSSTTLERYLHDNANLQRLTLSCFKLPKATCKVLGHSDTKELHLVRCQMADVEPFLSGLRLNHGPVSLCVDKPLNDEFVEQVLETLYENTRLEYLDLPSVASEERITIVAG
jgi:hypothetical protein